MKFFGKLAFIERVRAICDEVGPSVAEIAYQSPGMSFTIRRTPTTPKIVPKKDVPVQTARVREVPHAEDIEDEAYLKMRYPWSSFEFWMLRDIKLKIGNLVIPCALEPITAPRGGMFYLGKTIDETDPKGKKKRGLRSGDYVSAGDSLGLIVSRDGIKFHREHIVAEKSGHLDIPEGIDWASVKPGDTLMLNAVEKSSSRG